MDDTTRSLFQASLYLLKLHVLTYESQNTM